MKNSIYQLFLCVLFAYTSITNGVDLQCYNGSLDSYEVIYLNNSVVLLDSQCYQSERNTVIYAFGYQESDSSDTTKALLGAYLDQNVNLVLVNWEQEAGGLLGVSYVTTAVSNAETIGKQLGQALKTLSDAGLSLSKVHLIGFSLGAQLMAKAGEEVQMDSDLIMPKITGLDPAGPLFEGVTITTKLDKTRATQVVALHTNPGVFGTYEAIATVDIWPNCGSSIQPACDSLVELVTNATVCSHLQAVFYFAESVRKPTAFVARSATSCTAWKLGKGTNETINMGDEVDSQASGNYYCRTDDNSPYGLGEEGSEPSDE